jgi:GT2 family glycosyltransferase
VSNFPLQSDGPASGIPVDASQSTLRADGVPSVCCVLLNWNGWKDTVTCLRSLIEQDYASLRILVVDNASSDDSVPRIHEAFPEIELIEAGKNLGFASGCNVGIQTTLAMNANFIWLLNNDTVAPPDTLSKLVAASSDRRIGIVGTVLRYMHDPSRVQAWGGGRVLRWMGYVSHFTSASEFDGNSFLTFASVLIRREVVLDIGLLDETYFMYFDDADYCFRAQDAGWKLGIAADTAVLHREGGSTDSNKAPLMERIVTASGLRFLQRHAAVPPIAMSLFLVTKIGKRLVRGDWKGIRAVGLGLADVWHGRITPLDFEATR